jgi:hypothetical protein
MRQVHRKEVDPALDPGDLRQPLAKIRLRMTTTVPQRHEHLALQPPRQHLILNNGDAASVAVLIATPQTGYAEGNRANRYAQTLCPM